MLERLSVPENDTVTLVLFHRFALGPGIGVAVARDGVLSILIVTEAEVDKPTPFVAVQVNVTPGVSADKVAGAQPEEAVIPDSGSVTLHVTVTLLRYQPLLPCVPAIDG